MFFGSKKKVVYVSEDAANALFSIYSDIMGWVDSNRDYQDVEKAEKDAELVKSIIDQTDFEFEYKRGY